MYEGQTLICQSIIEENWLEYLSYVKKKSDEELEMQKKRQKVLAEFDQPEHNLTSNSIEKASLDSNYRYFDLNLNSFWNWYVLNKLESK